MSAQPQPSKVIPLRPKMSVCDMSIVDAGGQPMRLIMDKLEGVFGVGRRWSTDEVHALYDVCQSPEANDEMDLILAYRMTVRNKTNMFPYSTIGVLRGWCSILDRHRMSKKPKGVCQDVTEINRRKVESRMALLKARATDPETGDWLFDHQSQVDNMEYLKLKESL